MGTIVGALILAGASPAAAQVIVGRVLDDASGAGVARARVTAVGDGRNESRTLSGDDGRFTLAVRGGRYRVQVARTGYGNAASDAVTVGVGDTARVTLRVSAVARRLAGITASARVRRPPIDGVYNPFVATDSLLSLPIRAEGGNGRVIVRGQMATPTPCYRLAGVAERLGSVITLFVQARPSGDECLPGAIGATTYKLTARRIPAGTYTLRVLHVYRDDVWQPRLVADTTVTVQR